ncbi:cytochrome-c oxidase [Neisseriaceae bacterium B1]
MSIFKDNTDYSNIKPQPYKSLEEEEREREAQKERDATEVNTSLTDEQKQKVREQSDINPVEQVINDVLK